MKRILLFLAAAAVFGVPVFAVDYGAVISGQFTSEELDEDAGQTNSATGTVAPWLSMPLGGVDFYISAGGRVDYKDTREDDKTLLIPDLFRLEVSGKPADALLIKAGRISWHDPSRLVAQGRFDGADILLDLGNIRLSAAGFYTGFLYYDTVKVNVSPDDPDMDNYSADFDWDNFADTYFTPRRAFTALSGEFSGFPFERGTLHAGLMAQFDLSDTDERFNTQYALLRYTQAYQWFDFVLAGAAELEKTDEDGTRGAYAASAEAGAQIPGSVKNRVFLGAKWASGEGANSAAFFPLIKEPQGTVFQFHLSGIMAAYAGYTARLHSSLSMELKGRYFFRTDDSTYTDSALRIENDSYLLGAEASGTLLWMPASDLSFSLGGGAFFPRTGKALESDTPVRWSLTMGTIFSF